MSAGAENAVIVACADLAATQALAARLAPHLRAGDVVLLEGALAAGKTAFVAMLCHALGVVAPVTSPSYVIAHHYAGAALDVVHVDAWRLDGADEFADLGLEEQAARAVTLIEWGARVAPAVTDPLRVQIDFAEAGEQARRFRFTAEGARWQGVLDDLRRIQPAGAGQGA